MELIKKYDKIILIIILILQIIAIIYATSKRKFYHIDEFYSHGLMQYKRAFIFENEDFKNNWHTSDYFKDYLTITNENKWNFSAIYKNQIEDVHPPIWYLFLRIACMFNMNNFSIWPGTILNIIFFIFSSIMLYLIGKNVFGNNCYALLLCLLNGFSIGSIETVMFVRMYQLFILECLLLVYWHLKKKDKENFEIKKDLIPLYFMIIIGFLTHYYYSIIAVILYIMYILKYIKNKQYENIFKYTITLVFSVLTTLIIWPYSIMHIFFGYRGQETFFNASKLFSIYFTSSLKLNIKVINSESFNGKINILIAVILILIILVLIKKIILKKQSNLEKTKNKSIKYITIPMIIYLFIIMLISPYADFRYIMPILPLIYCSLLYLLKIILEDIVSQKITFYTILILIITFSLTTIPKLPNNTYTYHEYNEIIESDILNNRPIIYVYPDVSAKYNQIMSIYNILMYSNETYILPDDEVSSEKILDILKDKDLSNGIIVIAKYKVSDKYLTEFSNTQLFSQCEYAGGYIINGWGIFLLK